MTVAHEAETIVARAVESRDPNTGEVWRRFAAADALAVHDAVRRARTASHTWRVLPLPGRLAIIDAFRALLFESRDEMARTIARENGKPQVEAMAAEVLTTLDLARFYVRTAPRVLRERVRAASALALLRKRIRLAHEPYGVVGVISPWNYPLMLPAGIVLAALAAGNAVVLKPSELTPSTAELLIALLHRAGVPADVCALVQGDGATGAALTAADVDKVFFTGSVATGRRVAIACAERLVPCVLELGGSDPAIVLEDAPIAHTVRGLVWGRYANCGQTCVAPKRVFVVDRVHDEVVARMSEAVRALRMDADDAREVGALIRPSQRAALDRQLADAVSRGARVVATASARDDAFAPTLLVDVPDEALVLREETFGPLLPIIRVRDEDEAVARANASEFGLSASVWTRDAERGRRVAARLEAGTVVINDAVVVAGMADVPHGGVKASGTGRSHGEEGLLECVRTKAIVEDRLPTRTQPWWFGYGGARAQNMDAFARLAHGRSWGERLGGLAGTLRLLRER